MDEVTIKYSNSMCHKILITSDSKKYIMDMSTLTPNIYCFGFIPKKVEVEMVEIHKNNDQFKDKIKKIGNTSWLLLAVQPFNTLGYNMIKQYFLKNNVSQQIILKLLLFVFSILISFIVAKIYIENCRKKVCEKLEHNSKKYIATFKVSKKRDFSYYIFLGIFLILLYLFLTINNGTEGALLVVNSIVAFLFFIGLLGLFPIELFHKRKVFVLEKIEEKN